ncbi:MAG: UDP-N-acetylmuramoyl-tripeptide--D-alanyl-D-alanine ligase [Actinomycetota bacterium]|nr:UDP-N-acetylmuramoyl-tripeptide--D-alanyl-D-alanine ligase [Actinomycetota bacterium]
MIALSIGEIAVILGGRILGADPTVIVTDVVVDSREVSKGSMYVAIPGERVDGHEFGQAAMSAGAVVVLAEREIQQPCIVVEDSVVALGQLAHHVRQQLTACTVIAITASSGKTSTKDLLAVVLEGLGATVAPTGSFNTEVGVPLTILRADESTRFLILEMGMRGIGHIELLCQIASPEIGVLLNVGSAHLGLLGSRAEVAKAKGELIASLPAHGVAIINGDENLVRAQAERSAAKVVTFGQSEQCDVRARAVELDGQARASFSLVMADAQARVNLQVHGAHFVANALAVAAVAREVGMPLAHIAERLSAASVKSRWRMEVSVNSSNVTIINDAYNANPESMAAALQTLADMGTDRRKWAVLGEMLELGAQSTAEHAKLGQLAAGAQISRLLCIGQATQITQEHARLQSQWQGQSDWVPDVEAAIALLQAQVQPTDIVLIKASRGVGLERLATALGEREPQ